MKTIAFFLLALFLTNAFSMEANVGDTQLASCTRTEWTKTGIFNTPTQIVKQAEQKLTIKLVIDGNDISEESHGHAIRECAVEAGTQVGINLIALQPSDSSNAYRDAFLSCMRSNNVTLDNTDTVFLKTESICLWSGNNWAVVFGSDEKISDALDEIRRVEGSKIYLREGKYRSVKTLGNYQSAYKTLPEIQKVSPYARDAFLVNLDDWCLSPSSAREQDIEYFKCE